MTDPKTPDQASSYSSKLTRRLIEEAESLLGDDLDNEQIDQRFAALGEEALEGLGADGKQLNDLTNLVSLMSQTDGSEVGLDGMFKLAESDDEMFITVSITRPIGRGSPVTVKDIIARLRSREIAQGVMISAIKTAVQEAEDGNDVNDAVIVRGMLPKPGADPWIAYFGRSFGGEIKEISEDKHGNKAEDPILCQAGDTIARANHVDPGMPGYTALGKPLPAPACKSVELEAGPNVAVSGNNYVAQISGVILLTEEHIEVQKALIFNRDVGRSMSPVKFTGSVFVHGGVHSGVVIEATDNIVIDRVVEGATIVSTEGDVVLHAGIAGQNHGMVRAANDFIGGFVENASIVAGRDIKLQVGSLNSQMTAKRDILAESGKGSIAGGVLIAGNCIHAKRIGSYGAKTIIINGVGPEEIPGLSEISEAAANNHVRLKEISELVAQFDRAVRDPSKLTPQELSMYTNLRKLRVIFEHELGELENRRNDILDHSVANSEGDVKIYQKLDSDVEFRVGSLKYTHREAKGPMTITYDPNRNRIICHSR